MDIFNPEINSFIIFSSEIIFWNNILKSFKFPAKFNSVATKEARAKFMVYGVHQYFQVITAIELLEPRCPTVTAIATK